MTEGYSLVRPAALSCPDCAGTMRCEIDNGLVQYRCHIGHVLTGEAMLRAQVAQLDQRLGSALSLLNERAELCRSLAEVARAAGADAGALEAARAEALERARIVQALLEQTWVRPENAAEQE